jgi:hypothetical protein
VSRENLVLSLVLTFAVIFVGASLIIWAGTLFFQGYIYSEPADYLYLRGAAAGLALTLFFAFWCYLDYSSVLRDPLHKQGGYNSLFEFTTANETIEFPQFWAVKNGKEILYKARKNAKGHTEYANAGKPWSRSDADGVVDAIIVEDSDGRKNRFDAELTPDHKFKAAAGQPVRYVEEGGNRVMTDDYIGRITVTHRGRDLANLFLNFLHLMVWFACLWLIMRFQWSHALGLAFVAWMVMTLTVMPMLFRTTEQAAQAQPVQSAPSTSR